MKLKWAVTLKTEKIKVGRNPNKKLKSGNPTKSESRKMERNSQTKNYKAAEAINAYTSGSLHNRSHCTLYYFLPSISSSVSPSLTSSRNCFQIAILASLVSLSMVATCTSRLFRFSLASCMFLMIDFPSSIP